VIGGEGPALGYERMLDELVAAGYHGTELGDHGFMPTDPRGCATSSGPAA
jgi:inosose dehydratase